MKLDVKQNIPKLTMGVIFGLLVGVGIWFFLLKDKSTPTPFATSRQVSTVDRLRLIRDALENYRKQHGRLPAKLQELDIKKDSLMDGNGTPFVYQPDKPAKPIGRILVTAPTPAGKPGAGKEKWAYAIIDDVSQKRLFLHATTKLEEVAP